MVPTELTCPHPSGRFSTKRPRTVLWNRWAGSSTARVQVAASSMLLRRWESWCCKSAIFACKNKQHRKSMMAGYQRHLCVAWLTQNSHETYSFVFGSMNRHSINRTCLQDQDSKHAKNDAENPVLKCLFLQSFGDDVLHDWLYWRKLVQTGCAFSAHVFLLKVWV